MSKASSRRENRSRKMNISLDNCIQLAVSHLLLHCFRHLPTVLLIVYSCAPGYLPTVLLIVHSCAPDSLQLCSWLSTSCAASYLPTVLLVVYQLCSWLSTSCALGFLRTVLLVIYQMCSWLSTKCAPGCLPYVQHVLLLGQDEKQHVMLLFP